MKTFYIKQSVFSIKERYKIYNNQEELCYHCEGKLLTITSEKQLTGRIVLPLRREVADNYQRKTIN